MVLRGGFYKICLKKQDWIMANPIYALCFISRDTAIFLLQIICIGTVFADKPTRKLTRKICKRETDNTNTKTAPNELDAVFIKINSTDLFYAVFNPVCQTAFGSSTHHIGDDFTIIEQQ